MASKNSSEARITVSSALRSPLCAFLTTRLYERLKVLFFLSVHLSGSVSVMGVSLLEQVVPALLGVKRKGLGHRGSGYHLIQGQLPLYLLYTLPLLINALI